MPIKFEREGPVCMPCRKDNFHHQIIKGRGVIYMDVKLDKFLFRPCDLADMDYLRQNFNLSNLEQLALALDDELIDDISELQRVFELTIKQVPKLETLELVLGPSWFSTEYETRPLLVEIDREFIDFIQDRTVNRRQRKEFGMIADLIPLVATIKAVFVSWVDGLVHDGSVESSEVKLKISVPVYRWKSDENEGLWHIRYWQDLESVGHPPGEGRFWHLPIGCDSEAGDGKMQYLDERYEGIRLLFGDSMIV